VLTNLINLAEAKGILVLKGNLLDLLAPNVDNEEA